MPAHWYVEERSVGVAPEVNLRVCVACTPPLSMNKAHSDFETQRRHHRKSKTAVSVVRQKELCAPNFLKKFLVRNESIQIRILSVLMRIIPSR